MGIALGLLVFTKPQHVFFVPFLLLSAIWFFRGAPRRLAGVLVASTIGFCLVLSPWWYHNWRETGGYFIPFTTSGDRTLVDANNPTIARLNRLNIVGGRTVWEGAGKFLFKIEENELIDMRKFEPMDEVHRARYCRSAALGWIKSHPRDWAVLCLKKLGYAIGVWPLHQGSYGIALLNIAFGILLVLSIPGWWYMIRQPGWHRLMLLQIVTFLSLTIVFFGSWRYRNPFEGSVIIAAVLGAAILFPRAKALDPEVRDPEKTRGFDVAIAP
jgi:4-amino-4-deoxy-L-arabinose transferase-like glycosyltransferase